MQMFVLALKPCISASYLADVHVRVICREVTMLLSSWYYHNSCGDKTLLPYKPMLHPLEKQFNNNHTRKWGVVYAYEIFNEFKRRFGKVHASEEKYKQLGEFIRKNDKTVAYDILDIYSDCLTFSFDEKGQKVIHNLSAEETIKRYREYYKNKLNTMKVPVTYTNINRPDWSI